MFAAPRGGDSLSADVLKRWHPRREDLVGAWHTAAVRSGEVPSSSEELKPCYKAREQMERVIGIEPTTFSLGS